MEMQRVRILRAVYTSRSTLNAYQAHYTRSSGFRTRKCLPLPLRRVRLRALRVTRVIFFPNEKKEKEGGGRFEWKSIEGK